MINKTLCSKVAGTLRVPSAALALQKLAQRTARGACLLLCLYASTAYANEPGSALLGGVVEQAQAKVVKVYGAGGFRGMEGYQSGFVISADGYILTAMSYILDTDRITVTLDDGRKFAAKYIGGDPRLEVAVVKIEATELPHFDLAKAVNARAGTSVLALSNLYNVAMGNEPASVQHGSISVVTKLEGRRGVYETPYHGPVYVLDVTTNNPGAAGGALVTSKGGLVAMLGRELRNSLNNTWLNYAVPIDQLRETVEEIRSGKYVAQTELPPEKKPHHPLDASILGMVLVPDVVERTPAYVDKVRPNTAAARAAMQPDDLILLVGNHLTQSCKAFQKELEMIDRADAVKITVLRGQDLLEVTRASRPRR